MVPPGTSATAAPRLEATRRQNDTGVLVATAAGGIAMASVVAALSDRPMPSAGLTLGFVALHVLTRTVDDRLPAAWRRVGDVAWASTGVLFLLLAPQTDPSAPFWLVGMLLAGRGLTLSKRWPARLATAAVAVPAAAIGVGAAASVAAGVGVGLLLAGMTAWAAIMARRTDLALDDLRARDLLFEHTDNLFFEVDRDGHVVDANPGVEAALGWTRDELVGRHVGALYAQGQPRDERAVLEGRDGIRVEVEQTLVPLTGKGGDRLVLVQRDVTAVRRAEEAEQRRVQIALDQARAVGRADLAAYMLHNVGNTLNGITVSADAIVETLRDSRREAVDRFIRQLGEHQQDLPAWLGEGNRADLLVSYLQALAESLLNEQLRVRDEAHGIVKNVERLRAVIRAQEEWTQYSRTDEPVRLADVVDEALIVVDPSIVEHDIQVQRVYQPDVVVVADRYRILEILVNLLSNAIDAVVPQDQARRALVVRVTSVDGPAIEVEDRGPGIPEPYRDLVFTQGFTTKQRGSGMGLHVAGVAAQDMRGRLTFTTSDQGTTFRLWLPSTPRTPERR